ncbi:MAG: hypothetical protein FWF53_12535 [Candidatus Azobacteroides sp.]|nr:hypothetical protein [Candidatus Azobacteroides sp.]
MTQKLIRKTFFLLLLLSCPILHSLIRSAASEKEFYGIFREHSDANRSEGTSGNHGGFFKNDNDYFSSGTLNDHGGFFRDSSADNPGERPGNGGGIGQEAPVGDGLLVLTVCCVGLLIVKFFHGGGNNIKST